MVDFDSDLSIAMDYHDTPFTKDDIAQVIVLEEGEYDASDWIWAVRLHNGTCYRVQGGCDFTGWDCRSWLDSEKIDTFPEDPGIETRRAMVARKMAEGRD